MLKNYWKHVEGFGPFLSIVVGLSQFSLVACNGAPPSTGTVDTGEEHPGGETTNTLLFGINAFSLPAENITLENERQFFSGNGFFNQPWVSAPSSTQARDGLGPMFNMRSCSGCHVKDGRGRPPLAENEELSSLLFRLSVGEDRNEMPVGDDILGGQLQPYAISGVLSEGNIRIEQLHEDHSYEDGRGYSLSKPIYTLIDGAYEGSSEDLVLSPRVAPSMIGLGLLEAIPVERLEELADENDADADDVSGRIRFVPALGSDEMVVGRFGWKSEQPTLRQQSAAAFLGDMGLTTDLFPSGECTAWQPDCSAQPSGALQGEPEVSAKILDRVTRYVQLLAVPARARAAEPEILEGKYLFVHIGCADCHTPSHFTGEHELSELSHQKIFPYSDLLLHDMGKGLADGRGETRIEREWRTPPLWGLRFYKSVNDHERLLHDGRADGLEEAIGWHSGEAEASQIRFAGLSLAERELVLGFIRSL